MSDSAPAIPGVLVDEPLVRVKPDSKEPVIDSRTPEPTEEVQAWVINGGNAGICLSETGLVVVDVDDFEVGRVVLDELPETFAVRTGSGWVHRYYWCPDWDRNVSLGDSSIRSDGWMAVIPPSRHPNGERYTVRRNVEPVEVPPKALKRMLDEVGTETGAGAPEGHPEPSDGSPGGRLDDLDDLITHDGYREEVREVLTASDPAHNRRLWLAGFLSDAVGMSLREIVQLIDRHNRWVDYDRAITERQAESVVQSGGGR